MQPFAAEDPAHVRPPRAFARRVRIAFMIGVLVVDAVRGHPEDRPAFERQRGAPGEEVLDPLVGLVAAVRQQAVIAHADAQHARDAVQRERREHRATIDVEERGDRASVEAQSSPAS